MALRGRGLRAGGQQAAPATPVCYVPVHLGARGNRLLSEASQSARLELVRHAVGQTALPLVELRSSSGTTSLRPSSNTTGGGSAVGSHAWLNPCVRHIVTAIGQRGRAPMLHLVFSSRDSSGNVQHRFETMSITSAVADNPQRWAEFTSSVRSSGANGLVLVRPIASPDQHCVYATAATPGTPVQQEPASCVTCSPSPAAACAASSAVPPAGCSPSASCVPSMAAGAAIDIVEGHVGTCCESGRAAEHEPRMEGPQKPRSSGVDTLAAALAHSRAAPRPSAETGATQYYGLVVQGSCSSTSDGCWVLKTTSSDSGSAAGLCSCTHFSLTRVCLGQPLYTQLRDVWLV